MSRLYDNQPLRNLPVNNVDFPTKWKEEKFTGQGGVLLDGSIQGRSKFAIKDSTQSKIHYYVFHVKITRAHKRKFDSSGKEIEPNFSETHKISTGYLNSSYKVDPKGKTDSISSSEAASLIRVEELMKVTQKYTLPDCVSLWLAEDKCEGMEYEAGDVVRVKTKGNSPFILSMVKVDDQSSTVSNYAGGDQVGASWTDKIIGMKGSVQDKPGQEAEGVDEDEWDD